jgi:predicted RNase H-like nuclease (RuvC/YqgF family)
MGDKRKMTEEEYFRKNYPDSCYGDTPLSPHFDFFQDGVEFGERQSKKRIAELEKENAEQKDEVRKLKLLVSSLVYEINQIWDINEMNDDLRRCAEKIDREVQLSKMAEDNRMVISALGFAIVPPKPKLDVKEI